MRKILSLSFFYGEIAQIRNEELYKKSLLSSSGNSSNSVHVAKRLLNKNESYFNSHFLVEKQGKKDWPWLEDKQHNFVFSDNRKNALIYQEWVRSPESRDLNLSNKGRKSDNMFSVVKKSCSFVDLRLKRERSLLKTKNII